jgi:hypothetical protein
MYYTILWLIIWLLTGAGGFSFNSPVFWSLIVAVVADIFLKGFFRGR